MASQIITHWQGLCRLCLNRQIITTHLSRRCSPASHCVLSITSLLRRVPEFLSTQLFRRRVGNDTRRGRGAFSCQLDVVVAVTRWVVVCRQTADETHAQSGVGHWDWCPPRQPTKRSGWASWAPPVGSGVKPRPRMLFWQVWSSLLSSYRVYLDRTKF